MQPTDYGLGQILTSPLIMIGLALILGGCSALVWMYRDALGYREPEPEIPPVVQPPVEQAYIHPQQAVAANYRRPDSDTGVVPRIPGATPQVGSTGVETDQVKRAAGPVCPACGGPFGNCECYSQKSSTEETVVLPVILPVADLAPQYAALGRFFKAVGETRANTNEAMTRIVDDLAGRADDCPLTTQEIAIPAATETPVHRAIADREPTQELSKTVAKILEAQR